MRRFARRVGVSKCIKELSRYFATKQGVEPLKPGEKRPVGYYTTNSWTGTNGYPPGAVVRKST